MTSQLLDDKTIGDMLIRAHQYQTESEFKIDQDRFLSETTEVTKNLWLIKPEHSLYQQGETRFIMTTLVDYDEEEWDGTYEDYVQEVLPEEIRYWAGELFNLGTETKVEQLRAGYYWSTFMVSFK